MGDAALRLGSLSDSVNRVLPQTLTVQKKASRLALRLLGGSDGPDLTNYTLAEIPVS